MGIGALIQETPGAGLATVEAVAPLQGVTPLEFDDLVRSCQRRIYRLLRGLFRNDEVADALTQECFLRAYRNRQSYRGESSPETWLFSIALNLARDQMRSRRWAFWRRLLRADDLKPHEAPVQWVDPGPSPEQALAAREEVKALWTAVERLPVRQRTVFLLRFVEEMSLAEIAAVLGISIGAVKVHLHRATGTMRVLVGRAR